MKLYVKNALKTLEQKGYFERRKKLAEKRKWENIRSIEACLSKAVKMRPADWGEAWVKEYNVRTYSRIWHGKVQTKLNF